MTGYDISKYSDKALLQVHKEITEDILQETKQLLNEYDFKHNLEAEIERRGLKK